VPEPKTVAQAATVVENDFPADSREVKTFSPHTHPIIAVGMDSGRIVSVDEAGTVSVWDARGGHNLRNSTGILVGKMRVYDGNIIVGLNTTSDNIQVWDLNSGSPLRSLQGHEGRIRDLALADTYLASISLDNNVRLWDYHSGDALHTLVPDSSASDGLQAVALNLARVAAASGARIFLWNTISGKEMRTWDAKGVVRILALSNSGKLAGALENNHDIMVWNSENATLLHTLRGHEGTITALAVNDSHLVSASADGTIKVWDLNRGSLQNSLSGHSGKITAVALQGTHILSGGEDKTVRLWVNHLHVRAEEKPRRRKTRRRKTRRQYSRAPASRRCLGRNARQCDRQYAGDNRQHCGCRC
jgi:WD40 repeat protein